VSNSESQPETTSGRRVLVFPAPPTPNGDIHLGHLAGPYLGADYYTRYLRLGGVEAHHFCNSDENESYVRYKGEQMGLSPEATADHFATANVESFVRAGIEQDLFLRPNLSPLHLQMVEEFFLKLVESGCLVEKEQLVPYCESCEVFLCEVNGRGKCPNCGESSDPFACEACGRPIDATELVDPHCRRCSRPIDTRRPLKRLFLPLSRFEAGLRDYHRQLHMKSKVATFCAWMFEKGLPDIPVTQPTGWGTPVPLPGYEGQNLIGPFDTVVGALSATQLMLEGRGDAETWRDWWFSPHLDVVIFFGADNVYFYAFLHAALCLGYDPALRLPLTFVNNEFYQLGREKFSTTRQNIILIGDILAKASLDAVRFYLAYSAPENETTSFTWEEFEQTVDRELVRGWELWLHELDAKVQRDGEGSAPEVPDESLWTPDQRRFHRDLVTTVQEMELAYEASSFSPQRATRLLCELVRVARRFSKGEEPWRRIPRRAEERATSLALELLAAKLLAVLADPIMPAFAGRLWSQLGLTRPLAHGTWETRPQFIAAGTRVGRLNLPFFSQS
jgi:methionyl-tRNA synthetase